VKSNFNSFIFFIFLVFTISSVSGQTPEISLGSTEEGVSVNFFVKENTDYDVKVSCENQGNFCSSSVACNVTFVYPNSTILIDNQEMTNLNNGYFNYSLIPAQTIPVGKYSGRTGCTDGNVSATTTFNYEVTSTGIKGESIFNNPSLIFFGILSFAFLFLGVYFSNPSMGFIGSIIFLLMGVYMMIYGFNNITDFYTRGAAISIIGLGFIFMFASAYEWMGLGNEFGNEGDYYDE
jgi:hypothetical protein|tara:strand:- start:3781 stop:4485 length:705 start_codon:yes stop_codon:yes gene_type:complete